MPNLTDEEAADLAVKTINYTAPTPKQLAALAYIEQSILSRIHQEHYFVDLQKAFESYDVLYFRGMLAGKVDVGWSGRMTLCAGTCELRSAHSDGKRSTWPEGITVRIKLSEPILKFRPSVDVLNTLIHEMIHAYLFVIGGKHVRGDDPSGHGLGFLSLANAIHKHSQNFYSITVYHSFHSEVDHYRTHIWQCTGPCASKPPYFGLVKRSINRPPGPSDSWYRQHQDTCGGDHIKIASPPEKGKDGQPAVQRNKISEWLTGSTESKNGDRGTEGGSANGNEQKSQQSIASGSESQGKKRRRDITDEGRAWSNGWGNSQEPIFIEDEDEDGIAVADNSKHMVVCPVCFDKVWEASINRHLDTEHRL